MILTSEDSSGYSGYSVYSGEVQEDYDYIYDVLIGDILEGDLKAPEKPLIPQNARIYRDDAYRVYEHNEGEFKQFAVIKIL